MDTANCYAPLASKSKSYGYQFWLNGYKNNDPSQRIYPGLPADMYYCDGYAGQAIFIIPSLKLVIVRLGLTLDRSFEENAFIKSIIAAIPTPAEIR